MQGKDFLALLRSVQACIKLLFFAPNFRSVAEATPTNGSFCAFPSRTRPSANLPSPQSDRSPCPLACRVASCVKSHRCTGLDRWCRFHLVACLDRKVRQPTIPGQACGSHVEMETSDRPDPLLSDCTREPAKKKKKKPKEGRRSTGEVRRGSWPDKESRLNQPLFNLHLHLTLHGIHAIPLFAI